MIKFLADICNFLLVLAALCLIAVNAILGMIISSTPTVYGFFGTQVTPVVGLVIGTMVGVLVSATIFGPIAAIFHIRSILFQLEKRIGSASPKKTYSYDRDAYNAEPKTILEKIFLRDDD